MRPTDKVALGTAVAALLFAIAWGVRQFTSLDIPADVQAALTTVIVFVTMYFTPESHPAESAREAIATGK